MKADEEKKQLIIDYQQIPASVMADLRSLSKIDGYLNMLGNKEITPIQVAFAEGQRSVVIHIYSKLNKDPYEVRQERAINQERENDE